MRFVFFDRSAADATVGFNFDYGFFRKLKLALDIFVAVVKRILKLIGNFENKKLKLFDLAFN